MEHKIMGNCFPPEWLLSTLLKWFSFPEDGGEKNPLRTAREFAGREEQGSCPELRKDPASTETWFLSAASQESLSAPQGHKELPEPTGAASQALG